jgi:hypothetical protein
VPRPPEAAGAGRRNSLNRFCRLLLVVALLGTGCARQAAPPLPIALTHTITPWPLRVGQAEVILHLKDSALKPVAGAHIALEQLMSHPGMAPVFGEAREIAPGSYAGRLDLNMAGDWLLLAHITLANGENLERQIELRGVEAQ